MLNSKLTEERKLILNGYLCILREAKPNGRFVHEKAQYEQTLIGLLDLGRDLNKEYEEKIKNLIHKLYPNENVFDSSGTSVLEE